MRRNKYIDQFQTIPTAQGVSISPSEMEIAIANGRPISSQIAASNFNDGTATPHLDLEFTRGVDLGDLYEASRNAKNKIHEQYKIAKENFALKESINQLQNY